MHCIECEEALDKFLKRLFENDEFMKIEGPINANRLTESTQAILNRSGNDNETDPMQYILTIGTDLSIEISFLEWLLINKSKPIDLQKIPFDVFKTLVDEYCLSEHKQTDEKKKLIKAFKQTNLISLAKKLIAILTNTQSRKIKSSKYIYDRYLSDNHINAFFLHLVLMRKILGHSLFNIGQI